MYSRAFSTVGVCPKDPVRVGGAVCGEGGGWVGGRLKGAWIVCVCARDRETERQRERERGNREREYCR